MNPLTQVKNTQKITAREAALGISDDASWHSKYKDSAYIYAGNFAFDLTEGDLLAIFAQYGEIVDVNLIRDKGTGKSRGFAFLAYEDQRSTVLAVDNLNGASVCGRTIKVDHVANYKRKVEENEEEEQRKREERGVCRAFQRGDCTRGSACKFSHDEKRSANTGWGSKDDATRWTHDKYDRASQQAYRNRDDDGSRRDGVRLKEHQGTDFSEGSRRDGGSRLQERGRAERNSGLESERGSSLMKARKDRNENQLERTSEEREHQHRERDDGRDSRNHRSTDTQQHRGDDDSRHRERERKDQRNYRKNVTQQHRGDDSVGFRESDDRKDQRNHHHDDAHKHSSDDDTRHCRSDHTKQGRSDEDLKSSKSRKLDSGHHNDDEYYSGRRSHAETGKRDSRDGRR